MSSDAPAVIFACSPRSGGNSDVAAQALARGVEEAGGRAEVLALRDFDITACIGCGHCATSVGHRCVFAEKDDVEALFAKLMAAPTAFFASPIFFYHLPARFKAFIDRGQSPYERRMAGEPDYAGPPTRTAHVALVAGRPRGEQLFTGSMLTLKIFLINFRIGVDEPLAFRGKDARGDLAADAEALDALRAHAAQAWQEAVGRP